MGHDEPVPTRILTWNLQGRLRPDLEAVAEVVGDAGADIVALQEVQQAQARRLAELLGRALVWRCKHWPVVHPAEGLALLAHQPVTDLRTVVLAHPLRFWSWRRRVAVRATVATEDGPLPVVVTHLGAGVPEPERVRQAELTVGALGGPEGCIVGDLNTRPGSSVLAAYRAAGLRDAWEDVRPGEPGPTNWPPGPRDVAPTQRLDYVLVSETLEVTSASVPAWGDPGFEDFGPLSDHLPVTATLRRR